MKIKLTPYRIRELRPRSSEYTVWDTATPHFGVRITTSGTMRFIHLAPVDGRLKKKTIGDARTMPLDEARFLAQDIDDGISRTAPPCPLFHEWVDTWWDQAQKRIKPSTKRRNSWTLDNQLLPTFGEMRLDAINRSNILLWFERFSRTAPGNANKSLNLLSNILNSAKQAGLIKTNPVPRIRRNPSRKLTRFLSKDERDRLLAAIDELPPKHQFKGMIIKMLLFTGCRHGEILSLTWAEVGDKVLNLSDSKTGARKVWLGPEAMAVLDEADSLQNSSKRSEFVFPNPLDNKRCHANIGNFWLVFRKKVGIPDVRIHDLRHSFASEAVSQGVSLPVVSKLLGHSNIKMTMRYSHASNKDAEEAAGRIAEQIASLLV